MYEIQMYMINFKVSFELCKLNSTCFILEISSNKIELPNYSS